MIYKAIASLLAAVLVLVYMGPVVIKLKDVALSIVALIGVIMMLVDLWQSLRSKED